MTYRYKEHCGPNNDDHLGYRDKKEIKKWTNKDPISSFENLLLKNKKITKDQIKKIEIKNLKKNK